MAEESYLILVYAQVTIIDSLQRHRSVILLYILQICTFW